MRTSFLDIFCLSRSYFSVSCLPVSGWHMADFCCWFRFRFEPALNGFLGLILAIRMTLLL